MALGIFQPHSLLITKDASVGSAAPHDPGPDSLKEPNVAEQGRSGPSDNKDSDVGDGPQEVGERADRANSL